MLKKINAVGKIATFVSETLNKAKYAKRTEVTGADGRDLAAPLLGSIAEKAKSE